jgi:serine protease Do
MKFLKLLAAVVVVAGLGILTVYAQERRESRPRARELAILGGRGVQLGASVRDVDASDAEKQKLSGGVSLEEVNPNGAAAKAGLKRSDIIVEFDGEHVRSARQFSRLVQESPPGRTVKATIVRDGKRSTVEITPSEGHDAFLWDDERLGDRIRERLGDLDMLADRMPSFDFHFDRPSGSARGRLGVTVQTMSTQLAAYFGAKDGVLVTAVADDSAASRAGIKAGDVITSINGEDVHSSEDLVRSLRDAHDHVSVGLVRDKKELTVKVDY